MHPLPRGECSGDGLVAKLSKKDEAVQFKLSRPRTLPGHYGREESHVAIITVREQKVVPVLSFLACGLAVKEGRGVGIRVTACYLSPYLERLPAK